MDARIVRVAELEPDEKKPYHSPHLTEYGSVRMLTTGASGFPSDEANSGNQVFFDLPEG